MRSRLVFGHRARFDELFRSEFHALFFSEFFLPRRLGGSLGGVRHGGSPPDAAHTDARDMGRGVELVRVEREERTFDREKVLGRDTASVFPSLEGGGGAGEGGASDEAKKMASKFVTESELEAIRESGGEGPDSARGNDPSSSKPLYQILAERKEMKELEFEENWQSMKVGKNKPLDAEEVEFLDELENERKAAEKKRQREESEELEAFKRAQVDKASNPSVSADVSAVQGGKETPAAAAPPAAVVARKKTIGVRVKAKAPTTKEAPEETPASGGLGGLLGDYGSDSD